MKRLVTYFPNSNTAPLEKYEVLITRTEVQTLKEIAKEYPNGKIYTNNKGNLVIKYGRYVNEIVA